jgi:threonine aldolase
MTTTKIELNLSRESLTPFQVLEKLSKQCFELNIEKSDVYGDFSLDKGDINSPSYLRRFEAEVSNRLGKEDALFCPSGVMAQMIALKVHEEIKLKENNDNIISNSFICHHSSHILLHEQDSYKELCNMNAIIVTKNINKDPMLYKDVEPLLDTSPSPIQLFIECPHREIGGKCTSWSDLRLISAHCKRNGIKLHMDGARLWEAEAEYCKDGENIIDLCNLFDSIYVSFYKGLGSITGAMLVGTNEFINRSRSWLRKFGGNLYSQLPYAVSCMAQYKSQPLAVFQARRLKMKQIVALITEESLKLSSNDNQLVRFDPPIPLVSLIHFYLCTDIDKATTANEISSKITGFSCFTRLRPSDNGGCYTEFNMGPLNILIENEQWLLAWSTFLIELKKLIL